LEEPVENEAMQEKKVKSHSFQYNRNWATEERWQ